MTQLALTQVKHPNPVSCKCEDATLPAVNDDGAFTMNRAALYLARVRLA